MAPLKLWIFDGGGFHLHKDFRVEGLLPPYPELWELGGFVQERPDGAFRYPDPSWGWGTEWNDVPLVYEPNVVYLYSSVSTSRIMGCHFKGYSVRVMPGELFEDIRLRLWHELLHGLAGPEEPDQMHDWINADRFRRIWYRLTQLLRWRTEADWQREYYHYLSKKVVT